MKQPGNKVLYWLPRVLGAWMVGWMAFLSLSSTPWGADPGRTVLTLLVQWIPALVLLAGVLAGWKWEWFGGLLFLGFAGLFLVQFWGDLPAAIHLGMAGFPALVGSLFLINWVVKQRKSPV